jgi:hypothetical protein
MVEFTIYDSRFTRLKFVVMHITLLFPLIFLVVLVGLVLIAAIIKLRGGSSLGKTASDTAVYESQDTLLTPAERSFFGVLEQVAGSQFRLFAKVRLADIVNVKLARGENRSGWQSALNRITSKHVDFVLCDQKSFRIVGIIELDDKSHRHSDREERDDFLDAALQQADIPMLRIPARSSYSTNELRNQIDHSFKSKIA